MRVSFRLCNAKPFELPHGFKLFWPWTYKQTGVGGGGGIDFLVKWCYATGCNDDTNVCLFPWFGQISIKCISCLKRIIRRNFQLRVVLGVIHQRRPTKNCPPLPIWDVRTDRIEQKSVRNAKLIYSDPDQNILRSRGGGVPDSNTVYRNTQKINFWGFFLDVRLMADPPPPRPRSSTLADTPPLPFDRTSLMDGFLTKIKYNSIIITLYIIFLFEEQKCL